MNFKERYEDYLMHYGVPGMRWGVRKADYKAMSPQQRRETRLAYKENRKRERRKRFLKRAAIVGGVTAAAIGANALRKHIDANNRKQYVSDSIRLKRMNAADRAEKDVLDFKYNPRNAGNKQAIDDYTNARSKAYWKEVADIRANTSDRDYNRKKAREMRKSLKRYDKLTGGIYR